MVIAVCFVRLTISGIYLRNAWLCNYALLKHLKRQAPYYAVPSWCSSIHPHMRISIAQYWADIPVTRSSTRLDDRGTTLSRPRLVVLWLINRLVMSWLLVQLNYRCWRGFSPRLLSLMGVGWSASVTGMCGSMAALKSLCSEPHLTFEFGFWDKFLFV